MPGRQLIKLTGVNFVGAGYPIIAPTAYELAVFKLPGLRFWFSPESRFEALGGQKGLRERQTLADIPPFDAASGYGLGASFNSQPTLNLNSGGSIKRGLMATGPALAKLNFGYLAAGYTKVAIANKTADNLIMPLGSLDGGGGHLRIMGTTGFAGRIEMGHGAQNRWTASGTDHQGSTRIILASWDAATKAIAIEVNGVAQPISAGSGGATITDTPTPAAATKFGIGGWDADASSFANGQIGEVLMFDRPLALLANQATKFALYAQLQAKYGIALPTA